MHELNSQLVSLRDAYASARMMDAKLSDSLRRGDIDMSILSQSRSDVAQLLPAAKEAGGVDTRALESALHDLNTLIADRDRLLCGFKKGAEADQTSVILERLASGDSAVQVQADLLSSLEKLGDGIRETLATQSKLLDAVLSANQSFVERRVSSPQAMELDRVISRIEKSISRYTSITSQLQEGLVFYSNLQVH